MPTPKPAAERAAEAFASGRLERAAQLWRLHELCQQLGMADQEFVRLYGMPSKPKRPESIVYLVADREAPPEGHPVKVGFTRNIHNRLDSLKTGSVTPLQLLAYIEGGKREEAEIHARFEHRRIREDWFAMCDGIRAVFAGGGAA